MNLWDVFKIGVFLVAVLLLFLGQLLSSELLSYFGLIMLGLGALVFGAEAVITRRLVQISRYDRRASETYTGAAAVAQGIILIMLGLFQGAYGLESGCSRMAGSHNF